MASGERLVATSPLLPVWEKGLGDEGHITAMSLEDDGTRRPSYIVEIDRLILTGLDLTPAQAEQVRTLLATELEARLAAPVLADDAVRLDQDRLTLPALSPADSADPRRLAGALAGRIVGALPGSAPRRPRR